MEENHQVFQFKNITNSEIIEQLNNAISDREVLNICFFVTFKPRLNRTTKMIQKNLEEKTYEVLNGVKSRKLQEQKLQKLKEQFRLKRKSGSPNDHINALYEFGDYEKVIEILIPKQAQLKARFDMGMQNLSNQSKNEILKQYNWSTFSLGNSYFRLKNFSKACEYYEKTRSEEPLKQHAQRMNNLGTCFAIKKSYQQALKYYNEAIKLYNECSEQDVSGLLNNIAMIYLKCQMFKNAQDFFLQSIEERKLKSPNNKQMLYNSYYNLSICLKNNRKYEESLSNLFIAMNYANEAVNNRIDTINEICQVLEHQEKWSQALSYYERLSQEYERAKKPQGGIYQRVSRIHVKLGNLPLASKFAQNAQKQYRIAGDERKVSQISGSLVAKQKENKQN